MMAYIYGMAWHGMDCKHTPVPCSSQSLQSLRFYSSFPLVHEDPEEAGNKKTINDQMDGG
jgi:hypothetical protein